MEKVQQDARPGWQNVEILGQHAVGATRSDDKQALSKSVEQLNNQLIKDAQLADDPAASLKAVYQSQEAAGDSRHEIKQDPEAPPAATSDIALNADSVRRPSRNAVLSHYASPPLKAENQLTKNSVAAAISTTTPDPSQLA